MSIPSFALRAFDDFLSSSLGHIQQFTTKTSKEMYERHAAKLLIIVSLEILHASLKLLTSLVKFSFSFFYLSKLFFVSYFMFNSLLYVYASISDKLLILSEKLPSSSQWSSWSSRLVFYSSYAYDFYYYLFYYFNISLCSFLCISWITFSTSGQISV